MAADLERPGQLLFSWDKGRTLYVASVFFITEGTYNIRKELLSTRNESQSALARRNRAEAKAAR